MAKLQSTTHSITKANDDGTQYKKISERFSLYLPEELVKVKGWKKGDHITIIPSDRGLELVRTADL